MKPKKEKNMKTKTFVIAGLVAAAVSPAMADEFKPLVDPNSTEIYFTNEESVEFGKKLQAYLAAQDLSNELKAEKTKCISADNYWYDGKCIPKNPCKSKKAADKKYCITVFDKVQVSTGNRAARIVDTYAKNVLKWDGCAELAAPKSKKAGQDYIRCVNPANGDIRVFEFDDISESKNTLADNNYYYAMCISLKGKAEFPKKKEKFVECTNIKKKVCEDTLFGAFKDNKCTIKF